MREFTIYSDNQRKLNSSQEADGGPLDAKIAEYDFKSNVQFMIIVC